MGDEVKRMGNILSFQTFIDLFGKSCDRETERRIINSRYIDTYVYIIGINDERIL